jgi:hypothetical protein
VTTGSIFTRLSGHRFRPTAIQKNLVMPEIEPRTSGLAVGNTDHWTTEAVPCTVKVSNPITVSASLQKNYKDRSGLCPTAHFINVIGGQLCPPSDVVEQYTCILTYCPGDIFQVTTSNLKFNTKLYQIMQFALITHVLYSSRKFPH